MEAPTESDASDVNNVVSLNAKRAETAGDSRLWTALDALEYAANEIRAGRLAPQCVTIWGLRKPDEAGLRQTFYFCAGLTYPEHIALLTVANAQVLREWGGAS